MAKKKPKKTTPPPAPVRRAPARATAAEAEPTRRQVERATAKKTARRNARRRTLLIGAIVAAVVVAIVANVVVDRRQDAALQAALTSGGCTTDTRTDPTGPVGQNHVPSPTYEVNPPAGGDHLPVDSRSGVYRGAQVPPDGQLVHSLEHGYVIYWHAGDLPEAQQQELDELQQRFEGDVIVAERPGLPQPVAATAWGQRLLCQDVEPAALSRFTEAYVGRGPEDVPRG